MSRPDDEDDRPRPRRRDDGYEDDDYDDRPRRRRRSRDEDDWDRPPKKSGGNTLLIVLAVAGGALLLCCPIGIGLLLPAVQKVRDAAARTTEMNNLKLITLAAHSHADTKLSRLPPADADLSWRFHLLPFIEQQALYNQFDLNQPWDSAKNRPHANVPVKTYLSPLDPPGTTGTRYRVFVGEGTLFEPGKQPARLPADIPDGLANTVFVVEAGEAVPWPQPRELQFNPGGPVPALGRPERNDVLVVMMDGSVRRVEKARIDPALLRAIVTPAGREPIPADW